MTDPTMSSPPRRRFAQRALGAASLASGGIPLAAFAVVWMMGSRNDPIGYLILPIIIVGIYATPVGIVLGIIGVVIATVRRCGYLWPVIGGVVSLGFASLLYLMYFRT
ncbi:hypothetical protein [Microbacterium testaceum]|jgi:hypothetical protein|nr:hypothetical protein [Microbacterium testaceum]